MADPSSPFLLARQPCAMNDSTPYWQAVFEVQRRGIEQLLQWQSFMDQNYAAWSTWWQPWHQALEAWLTRWADLSGYTLQSQTSFALLLPSLPDFAHLQKAVVQLLEHYTDSMFLGGGALAPGRAAALPEYATALASALTRLTQHLETMAARLDTLEAAETQAALAAHLMQLHTVMAEVNQQLEAMHARLDTSDTAVTQRVEVLREQMQTTHQATLQQLTALAQRLEVVTAPPNRSRTRPTTPRQPSS